MAEENEVQDQAEQGAGGDAGASEQADKPVVDVATLQAEMALLRQQNAEMSGVLRQVHSHLSTSRSREAAAIQQKMDKAAETADVDTYNAAKQELAELTKQDPRVNGQATNTQANPAFDSWHKRNNWYGSDPDLTAYAETIGAGLNARGYQGQALFDQIEREVKARYPQKFQPAKPISPEGGGQLRQRGSNAKKTEADLPPDALKAADKFIRDGLFKDRAEYAADYFAELEKRSPRAA